jgi:hypothetical protein
MHASSRHAVDPFGMLIDPQAIVRALEGSQRLECLNRRVCRPLDRMPPGKGESTGDQPVHQGSLDRALDSSLDE